MESLKFKMALDAVREYKKIERLGKADSRSVDEVFKVYKALAVILPYAEKYTSKEYLDILYTKSHPLAYQFSEFLVDLENAIVSKTKMSMPSSMHLELMTTIEDVHEEETVKRSTAMTSSHVSTVTKALVKKTFGYTGRVELGFCMFHFKPAYEILTEWTYCQNHVNDMVNFALAIGIVSDIEGVADAIVDNHSFE